MATASAATPTPPPGPFLVLGATGATGSLVASQLLARGAAIRCIVRDAARVPDQVRAHPLATIVEASVADMPDDELRRHVRGCAGAVSCLGHTLSFGGIFGKPRDLCARTTRRVTDALAEFAAEAPSAPHTARPRFVLMNTAGAMNLADADGDKRGFAHRMILGALRWTVPPANDNEQAAWYLHKALADTKHGAKVDWCVVRPDNLINADAVTPYTVHSAPTRDCLFNPGTTSRINAAHLMAALMTDDAVFAKWRNASPVVYNEQAEAAAATGNPSTTSVPPMPTPLGGADSHPAQ